MKKPQEPTVTTLNLQTFRTLPEKERAEKVKDWVKRASEAGLNEEELDIPPNERNSD